MIKVQASERQNRLAKIYGLTGRSQDYNLRFILLYLRLEIMANMHKTKITDIYNALSDPQIDGLNRLY